jgi:hypothetical protein
MKASKLNISSTKRMLLHASFLCLATCSIYSEAATVVSPYSDDTEVPSRVLLPAGHKWEYTFSDPTGDPSWNTTTGGWQTGPAPFGNQTNPPAGYSQDFNYNTYWDQDKLWVRTTINTHAENVTWNLGVDNEYRLFLNGDLVSVGGDTGYTYRWEYSGDFSPDILNPGANIIALELDNWGDESAFDMEVTVPIPAAIWLFGSGLVGFLGLRKTTRV